MEIMHFTRTIIVMIGPFFNRMQIQKKTGCLSLQWSLQCVYVCLVCVCVCMCVCSLPFSIALYLKRPIQISVSAHSKY